jgi:predicted  nucleic acid-binding Zn-ribbon protein
VTCAPIDIDDFRNKLQQLRKEYPSAAAILKAQEEAAREVRRRINEAERKTNEVQKALDKKRMDRDTELRVLSKYQKGGASEI